jgi:hypothetical protein
MKKNVGGKSHATVPLIPSWEQQRTMKTTFLDSSNVATTHLTAVMVLFLQL